MDDAGARRGRRSPRRGARAHRLGARLPRGSGPRRAAAGGAAPALRDRSPLPATGPRCVDEMLDALRAPRAGRDRAHPARARARDGRRMPGARARRLLRRGARGAVRPLQPLPVRSRRAPAGERRPRARVARRTRPRSPRCAPSTPTRSASRASSPASCAGSRARPRRAPSSRATSSTARCRRTASPTCWPSCNPHVPPIRADGTNSERIARHRGGRVAPSVRDTLEQAPADGERRARRPGGADLRGMLIAIGDVRDSGQRARESQESIAASNALQTLVLNVETSARGYVITRRSRSWLRTSATSPPSRRRRPRSSGSSPAAPRERRTGARDHREHPLVHPRLRAAARARRPAPIRPPPRASSPPARASGASTQVRAQFASLDRRADRRVRPRADAGELGRARGDAGRASPGSRAPRC